MNRGLVFLTLGVSLLLGAGAGLALGPVSMPPGKVLSFFLGQEENLSRSELLILGQVRLPRVVLAVVVGAALAVAGGVMQGVFRNPLASPYTLGVAGGASAGMALALTLRIAPGSLWVLPGGALLGAAGATVGLTVLSRSRGGISPLGLVLAGVALSSLFSALTSVLIYFSNPQEMGAIMVWTMGGLGRATAAYVGYLGPVVGVGIAMVIAFARDLDLLALGDHQASHMGTSPSRARWFLLGAATVITAAAVACAGPIGFVGLIVPHALRLVLGPTHTGLLAACALGGAGFLLWADLAARMVLRPVELPVGIITAFLGVPFFLYLLRRGVAQ